MGCRPGRRLGRHRMAAAPSLAHGDRHRGAEPSAPHARRAMPPRSARPICRSCRGRAPEAFAGLPAPDAVFIGGGLSNAGLFEAAWAALKPGGRLVANAVSHRVGGASDRLFPAPRRRAGAPRSVASAARPASAACFVWRAGGADHAMAGEEAMIVAGVGCRRGTSADEIERVGAPGARHASSCRPSGCRRSPTESEKATEPGLRRSRAAAVGRRWSPAR